MLPTLTSSVRQKSQSFIELVTQHMSYICASFFGGQDDTMLHHDAYPMLGIEDQALDTQNFAARAIRLIGRGNESDPLVNQAQPVCALLQFECTH